VNLTAVRMLLRVAKPSITSRHSEKEVCIKPFVDLHRPCCVVARVVWLVENLQLLAAKSARSRQYSMLSYGARVPGYIKVLTKVLPDVFAECYCGEGCCCPVKYGEFFWRW
jgi:hypothetical protein